MVKSKIYPNGLKLIVNTLPGFLSVSAGVMVNTGSRNESESENGLSHFIEHAVFKGTVNRSSFEISDFIDGIGAQINAYTSKEVTCYYTKSTKEHLRESVEVLSDIFFNATFDKNELEKEKDVIIEEINMSEDTPEDLCFDLLSQSYFGKSGLGRTILGTAKNVKSFNKEIAKKYMGKYYTSDNVVVAFSGNVDFNTAEKITSELFNDNFRNLKRAELDTFNGGKKGNEIKTKRIEQSHIGLSLPTFSVFDSRKNVLNIANTVFGGGMSSRLFQKIREELGLCYNVYSYASLYRDCGVLEIYTGVNNDKRDDAFDAIVDEIKLIKKQGITEKEFLRGKEQMKSSFILGQENTSSLMLLYAKYFLLFNENFDFESKIKEVDDIKINEVNDLIYEIFDENKLSCAYLGPKRTKLNI